MVIQSFAGKSFRYCSCPFSEARMHQSQNFALQIGLELMVDRDPLPQNPATIETYTAPTPVSRRLTLAPLRFFNACCALITYQAYRGYPGDLRSRSRLLRQYHSIKSQSFRRCKRAYFASDLPGIFSKPRSLEA